jgi:hypothetical protein
MNVTNFLPSEDPQDYAKLKAALFAEYDPCSRSQEKLVMSVTKALWKLRRAQRSRLDHVLASDTSEPATAGPIKPSQE